MNGYGRCPRCGRMAFEHLKTHSHCWECGFFPEWDTRLRVKRQLMAEAMSGKDFSENDLPPWSKVFDDDHKPPALSEDALDHYYAQVKADSEDIS